MERPLKVLCVGHPYVVGVNRAIVRKIAEDPRVNITVLAPSDFHGSLRRVKLEEEPGDKSIQLIPIRTFLSKTIQFFFFDPLHLSEVIASQDWDCIYIWEEAYVLSGWQVGLLAKKRNIPFMFLAAQNIAKRYPMPFRQFESWMVKNQTKWVPCGHLVKEALVQKGYSENDARLIEYWVDTEKFRPLSDNDKESKKNEIGLRGPLIGMLGRMTEDKGVYVLLEALEKLPAELPWSIVFWGDGPEKEYIQKTAKKNGWESRVHIQLLKHHEVPMYLPCLDVLVAPSQTRKNWKEQFGRMLVEAFASGVPVLASDSGEIPYVVGDAGVILPEADSAAWTEALEKVLTDEVYHKSLVQKGWARTEMYSVEHIAAKFKSLFFEVIEKSG